MQNKFNISVNGQELQQSDINQVAQEAALADDLVFAELLRVAPYDGTVHRGVLPYKYRGLDPSAGTVSNGGATITGGLCVNPFRAVVGSRATGTTKFSDIRSALYVNAAASSTDKTVTIAAQSAGAGTFRIDLVYATIFVDQDDAAVSRYVRNTTGGTPATSNIVINKKTYVTVAVQAGTASSTPTLPTVPSDPAGGYVIPLAYVRVANGFTSTSVVPASSIIEIASVLSDGLAPANLLNTSGTPFFAGTIKSAYYMPPSMAGKTERVFGLDGAAGTTAVIDNSVSWLRRTFKINVQCVAGNGLFAWSSTDPLALPNASTPLTFMCKSYGTVGDPLVLVLNSANTGGVLSSGSLNLYVSQSTGSLYYTTTGTVTVSFMFWLEATAPFTNLV